MLRTFLLAAAALALSACASTTETADGAPAERRDCFRALDVSGYGVIDAHTIRVTVSPAREYALTVNQNTRDIDWTHAISIRSATSFICTGNGAGVSILGGDPPIPAQVTRIERLPPTAPAGS